MLPFILLAVTSMLMRVCMSMRVLVTVFIETHHLLSWFSLVVLHLSLQVRVLRIGTGSSMSVIIIVFFIIFFIVLFIHIVLWVMLTLFTFMSFHLSLRMANASL